MYLDNITEKQFVGSFARSTGPQPRALYRSPLADVTNCE